MNYQEYHTFMNTTGIRQFVERTCAGRDASHGVEHMEKVAENLLEILKYEHLNRDDETLALIAAWLHDVFDHKYDTDGTLEQETYNFLKTIVNHDDAMLIMHIIHRVSYSREVRVGDSDWVLVLGHRGCRILELVSSADKLEAIGCPGLVRCAYYTIERNPGITDEQLMKAIRDHADEKLLLLKDKFIRSVAGKQLAQPLHDDMVTILNDDVRLLEIIDAARSI